jgi:hypothetical protein
MYIKVNITFHCIVLPLYKRRWRKEDPGFRVNLGYIAREGKKEGGEGGREGGKEKKKEKNVHKLQAIHRNIAGKETKL